MLHRDLKPDNILLTAAGDTKLLGFGLVKPLAGSDAPDDVTRTVDGAIVGTAAHVSPEQAQERPRGRAWYRVRARLRPRRQRRGLRSGQGGCRALRGS
jgi:serine/threonine protein kinase